MSIRIGTRGSKLALAQANIVAQAHLDNIESLLRQACGDLFGDQPPEARRMIERVDIDDGSDKNGLVPARDPGAKQFR